MIKRQDIRIRDPFIITDKERGCYYMYGTTGLDNSCTYRTYTTFSVYKTYDLENFEEPKIIFDGSKIDFWGKQDYWAPEVHKYNGKYYLFASFKAEGAYRATHILVSDTPDGTFVPVSNAPATPKNWECLDGTLYVEDGVPYIVFCHEWLQVGNGEICACQLSQDLSTAVGEPFLLFRGSDDPFVTEVDKKGSGNYVTDGPFFYCENGKNKMIWSSLHEGRYVVLSAELDGIKGKIRHNGSLFDFDGGHAMIFNTLDGKRMISLHSPNKAGLERPHFFEF